MFEPKPAARVAIVVLSTPADLQDLRTLDASIAMHASGFDESFVFHNGGLSAKLFQHALRNATFHELNATDWGRFPRGFDPASRVVMYAKRGAWAYNHMIRSGLHKMPHGAVSQSLPRLCTCYAGCTLGSTRCLVAMGHRQARAAC